MTYCTVCWLFLYLYGSVALWVSTDEWMNDMWKFIHRRVTTLILLWFFVSNFGPFIIIDRILCSFCISYILGTCNLKVYVIYSTEFLTMVNLPLNDSLVIFVSQDWLSLILSIGMSLNIDNLFQNNAVYCHWLRFFFFSSWNLSLFLLCPSFIL